MLKQHTFHITVAAMIELNGKYLMVTDDTSTGYKINQPAGHVEDEESIINAVIRETKEECGLDFIPTHIVGIYMCKLASEHTYLRFCFKGTFSGDIEHPKPLDNDDGVIEANWYTLEQIKELPLRSDLVLKCIDDYQKGNEYDLSIISEYKDLSNK